MWGSAKSPVRDLTINGNGVTIDGKGSKCFLTVYSGYSITINDLNIVNNYRYRDGGGSICVNEGGELHVNGCSFTNCRTPNKDENVHGGAIRGGFNAKIYIDNSIFKQNFATFGGGAVVIGASVSDAALNMDHDMDATTITPTLVISNSQFIENSAGHGGAINIEDFCAAVITNCTFTGNAALDKEVGLGGGICTDVVSYLISTNNTFQDNTAERSGGGIYNAPNSPLIINGNTFIKNQAFSGGAVCNVNGLELTIADSIFTENNATNIGGAIHNIDGTTISISNSTFAKNVAGSGGAISNLHNIKITITDCAFNNNAANKFGGALQFAENSNIIIENTEMENNVAVTNGGAICIGQNTNMTTINATFSKNEAGSGGAITMEANSRLTSDNTTFIQNNASKSGGAIYMGQNTEMAATNTTFSRNTADDLGGAICGNANSKITAIRNIFTQNRATKNGGAIYTNRNNIVIRSSKLTRNVVGTNGGVLYIGQNTNMTAINATFSRNAADGFGGAICSVGESNVLLINSAFDNNVASRGNALYNPQGCTLTFKGATFVDPADYYNTGDVKIEQTIDSIISIDSIEYSSDLIIEGKLLDEYDSPIVNETVFVNLENGKEIAKTDCDGKFIARFENIIPGTYEITATFNGNSIYGFVTANITKRIVEKQTTQLAASDMATTYNSNENLVITLKDIQDSPIANAQIAVDFGDGPKYYTTDNNGQVRVSTNGLAPNTYDAKIIFDGSDEYKRSNASAKITVGKGTTRLTATNITTTYNANGYLMIVLKDNQNAPLADVRISVDWGDGVKYYRTGSNGEVRVSTMGLTPNAYAVNVTFDGNENYTGSNAAAMMVVNKGTTKLITADMKITYDANKYLVIALKDAQNNPLTNVKIAVDFGFGVKYYNIVNGQVKVPTNGLKPVKTYVAKITFAGNSNYDKSTATAKVVVKKATPKITAKATTFKRSLKNKKYTIILKTDQNKAMKKTKVYITVNKKTYYAKTTSKGVATFKITKLTKKGKYTAIITYKGDACYNKLTQKVKIKIK